LQIHTDVQNSSDQEGIIMPKEDRFISFDLEEVYQALTKRCEESGIELPKAHNPVEAKMSDDKNAIVIFFEKGESAKKHEQKFDLKFFIIALVFFCNSKNIPIPKAGKKTLNIQDDRVIMRIEMQV
jgi:hypothetical protein